MKMILLDSKFIKKYAKHLKGCCMFFYNTTINGEHFCDVNSVKEFPEIFEKMKIQYIIVKKEHINDDIE